MFQNTNTAQKKKKKEKREYICSQGAAFKIQQGMLYF